MMCIFETHLVQPQRMWHCDGRAHWWWLCADGDYELTESLPIVEYLDKKYGKANNRLLPDDAGQYGKVLSAQPPISLCTQAIAWLRLGAATICQMCVSHQ